MQILPVAEAVLNDPGAGRLDPGFHLHDEHLRTIKRDPHVMRFKFHRKSPHRAQTPTYRLAILLEVAHDAEAQERVLVGATD